MIKHLVFWNVAGESRAERDAAIDRIRNAFEALNGRIPGLMRLEIGTDFSRIDYACDVALYSEFEDEQALADYAVHPAHRAAAEAVAGLRIARHQVDFRSAGQIEAR